MFEHLKKALPLDRDNLICLDTETTGLNPFQNDDGIPEAEILTLSIIDGYGNMLFDKMFKPSYVTEWAGAEAVNGISPEMVKDCPSIKEYLPEIQSIMDSKKEILGYNVTFDTNFLKEAGVELGDVSERIVHPTMQDFAWVYFADVEQEFRHDTYEAKWRKLTVAADHINYEWTGRAHGSLADAKATLALAEWLYTEGNYNRAVERLTETHEKKPIKSFSPSEILGEIKASKSNKTPTNTNVQTQKHKGPKV